jgi:CRAL/TRIO domain
VNDILKACSSNEPNAMTPILQKENETSKLYVRGYDQEGRALLYMRPAKENTNDAENNMRHLVWNLEKAIACSSKHGRSKICIVIDYDGFALRHSPPLSTSRYTLDILQKHYPERMHKAYICNPPFVFRYDHVQEGRIFHPTLLVFHSSSRFLSSSPYRTFWTLVKPFIDPVTKSKIVFCSGKKGLAQIVDDVGPANQAYLEPCAGGTEDQLPVDSPTYLSLPFDQAYGEKH